MNDLIRLTAKRVIINAEREMADMARAIEALRLFSTMNHINDLPDPLEQINIALRLMPEFSEDMTCDLETILELIEAEIDDPICNGCGLTATVATEGGQGEKRGCECDPEAEEAALDRFRDGEADMIEYQKTER